MKTYGILAFLCVAALPCWICSAEPTIDGVDVGLVSRNTPTVFSNATDSVTALQVVATNGTAVLNVDTTNERLGIGTAAPAAPLEVYSSAANTVKINAGYVDIIRGSATVRIDGADGASGGDATISNNGSGGLHFGAGGLGLKHVTVHTNGYVGIGTTGPDAKLHVQAGTVNYSWSPNARTVAIFEGDYNAGAAAGAVIAVVGYGTNGYSGIWLSKTNSQSAGQINYYYGGALGERMAFNTAGTPKLTIQSDGDVGIGDTTPTFKLDINGTLRVTSKATFAGGTDPKYVHTERTTEAEIFAFIKRDIPPSKLNGIVAFFAPVNGKLSMWGWIPSSGKVYNLITGELEKTVAGLTAEDLDYEYRTEYRLDPERGIIMSDEIAIDVPNWKLRTDYRLDETTGQCYDPETNAVPLAEAIEH